MSIVAYAQNTSLSKSDVEDLEPYDYKNKLLGGYKILFKADDSLEYIYLIKGRKKIAELSSCSRGMLYKNLGYVGADFKEHFVLVYSFGSGNPHLIELIKKSTGKNIFSTNAWWIDVDEKKEVLLYSNENVPKGKNKMILYHIKTGQKRYFPFPKEMLDEPMILNRIQIKLLSSKSLIIEYEAHGNSKTKKYAI